MRTRHRSFVSSVCEYAEAVLVAVLWALYAKAFVFQIFEIPSGSMEKTLLIGDHVLVNKFIYGAHQGPWARLLPYRDPAHGDVLVFRSPEESDKDLIKRVTALGGDSVGIESKELLRNLTRIHEPYVIHRDPRIYEPGSGLPETLKSRDFLPVRNVPAGQMFMLGDNRDYSRDSRYWGPASMDLVKGRAVVVFWSLGPERAEDDVPKDGGVLHRIWDRAVHFFSRMRWQRTFHSVR